MSVSQSKLPQVFDGLIKQGILDFEAGHYTQALALFRQAAVADLRRPEAWFWMGRVYEEQGDKVLAGHSFYMAGFRGPYALLVKAALNRIGFGQVAYLGVHHEF